MRVLCPSWGQTRKMTIPLPNLQPESPRACRFPPSMADPFRIRQQAARLNQPAVLRSPSRQQGDLSTRGGWDSSAKQLCPSSPPHLMVIAPDLPGSQGITLLDPPETRQDKHSTILPDHHPGILLGILLFVVTPGIFLGGTSGSLPHFHEDYHSGRKRPPREIPPSRTVPPIASFPSFQRSI